MTPEQSKAQVVDAAKDVGKAVSEPVESAHFSRSSCNDQGDPPYRGIVDIYYAVPSDSAGAAATFDKIKQQLQSAGWGPDSEFKTHGGALKKDSVDAVLYPADASVSKIHVILYGECRDTTTTKATAGSTEDIVIQ
jgi:hypothetical protein